MSEEKKISISVEWPIGWVSLWLFTIGFADLGAGRALVALLLWPYYLGASL